jgi:predicted RNA-binding Zn ribbon-like protein
LSVRHDPPAAADEEVSVADPFETRWAGVGKGGCLALEFVNTVDWRLREPPVELLGSYAELLRWAWTAEAIDAGEARSLRKWGEAHPRKAKAVLADAVRVREAMAAIFEAVSQGEDVPSEPLAGLDEAIRSARAGRALRAAGDGAEWTWRDASPDPRRPMWAAALDGARLLTSEERTKVRQCGDAECGWFFLDTSRNHSRRWCSMDSCGNRNKARRFYRRSAGRRPRGD